MPSPNGIAGCINHSTSGERATILPRGIAWGLESVVTLVTSSSANSLNKSPSLPPVKKQTTTVKEPIQYHYITFFFKYHSVSKLILSKCHNVVKHIWVMLISWAVTHIVWHFTRYMWVEVSDTHSIHSQ